MAHPIARFKDWARRLRGAPSALERIEHRIDERDAELVRRIDAIRPLFLEDLRSATRQIHRSIASVERRFEAADGAAAEQGTATRAVLDAPRLDALYADAIASVGPARPLRPGLSIFTITWNHAHVLPEALASGLALLDALGDGAGELLVLDNGSTDETERVLVEISARDARVRVVRVPENIGLARARNVLLATCDREHALMLDADNTVETDGAQAVYEIARRHRSLLTYGTLTWRDDDGVHLRIGSTGPVTAGNLGRLDVDTFMVVDVAGVREIGGWTLDPALQAFDDQELVRRVASRGGLVGFVPVLLGRYRATRQGHSRARGDLRPRVERIERLYHVDAETPIASFVTHPDTEVLWASAAAAARDPQLAVPDLTQRAPDARRILVIASGGVGNLGDDLITAALVERVARVCPQHDVELVTDGAALAADLGPCLWSGTISEALDGLDRAHHGAGWAPIDVTQLDGAVVGGGGNLNSIWRDDLVARRARLLDHLTQAGVPILVTGQGVGPFISDDDAAAVRDLLARAQSVGVRDARSRAELSRLGMDAHVVGDDALGHTPAPDDAVRRALSAIGADPAAPVVALHARRATYVGIDDVDLAAWAGALDAIAVEDGAQVVGVALNWAPPVPEPMVLLECAAERKAPWRILDDPTRPTIAAGVLRSAECALVASYHAALVAIEAGVPTLYCAGADYSLGKAEGLRELAELPPAFVVTPGTPADELAGRFSDVARALRDGAGLQPAANAVEEWSSERLRRLTDRAWPSTGRP